MAESATAKTSWADDVEVDELELAKVEDYVDENGIRITVEYSINDAGKKVKVRFSFLVVSRTVFLTAPAMDVSKITKKIKRTLQKSLVDHTVAERKQWTKFGMEKGTFRQPFLVF